MFQLLGDKGRSRVADWLEVIHSLAPRARLWACDFSHERGERDSVYQVPGFMENVI